MAVPTFVSYASSDRSWNTANALSQAHTIASVAVNSGDILVVVGGSESGDFQLATPAGGGLTYTQQQKPNADNDFSHCHAYIWTATATSTTSFNVTSSCTGTSGTHRCGIGVYVFRDSNGVTATGAGNEASGTAPSLALSTTQADSTIVFLNTDYAAVDGTSRTWRTINSITPTAGNTLEKVYVRNASAYAAYSAYWTDAGAAGSKTTGLSAPTGQTGNSVAIEVLGIASAAVAKPKSLNYQAAVSRSFNW